MSPGLNRQRSGRASAASYARLIPGLATQTADVHKKRKAQSVRVDRTVWTNVAQERIVVPESDPLQFLSGLLPQPQSVHPETNLLRTVLTDLCITMSGAVLVLASFSLFPTSISLLRPAHNWELLTYVLLQAALMTLIGHSEGLYWTDCAIDSPKITARLAKSFFWATTIVGVATPSPNRVAIVISGIVGLVGTRASRRFLLTRLVRQTPADAKFSNVLIVGTGSAARAIASYFHEHPQLRRKIVGFVSDLPDSEVRVLGRIANLEAIARAHFVDKVIVSLDDPRSAFLAVRSAMASHLDVDLLPDITPYAHECRMTQVDRLPLIHVNQVHPPAISLSVKRALDILGSAVGLILSAPLLAALALWIKLDSPGPVFYSAPRVGRKGVRFRCYKLRTMSSDADAIKDQLRSQNQREGPFFKIARDPRITRCGRWLRRYSLDELPQLWNVLRGDMSLVGPRPHPLDDVAGYQLIDLCRLDVRPGLTGLWQTTARSDPSFRTNIRLDREYIERWSLALDFRILIKTFRVVAAGGGC